MIVMMAVVVVVVFAMVGNAGLCEDLVDQSYITLKRSGLV
jgi:ABC-type proline/glycine betaine transport system permease subunit